MFEERIQRLFQATGVQTDSELARMLDIQPPSVAGARRRQLLPGTWIEKIALDYQVSADWLLFGRGPMRPSEVAPPAVPETSVAPLTPPAAPEKASPACAELKRELEQEKHERRQLSVAVCQMTAQNRELTIEVRSLWKENSELREKCTRFEAQQYQRSLSHGGGETLGHAE